MIDLAGVIVFLIYYIFLVRTVYLSISVNFLTLLFFKRNLPQAGQASIAPLLYATAEFIPTGFV